MHGAEPRNYYDDYWHGSTGWMRNPSISRLIREMSLRIILPDSIVLDVGCGNGERYGAMMARVAPSYYGIDISDVAIESARKNGIMAMQHDLQHPLPYSDGMFDVIICLEVLEHLFDPAFVLSEIRRVLKPHGVIMLSVPNVAQVFNRLRMLLGEFSPGGSPDTSSRRQWADPHIRFFTAKSLRRIANENALRINELHGESFSPFNSMPVFSPLMARLVGWQRLADWSRPFEFMADLRPSVFAGNLVALLRPDSGEPKRDNTSRRAQAPARG